jgi:HAD superfamily hydrolase (TIGR01509 family)
MSYDDLRGRVGYSPTRCRLRRVIKALLFDFDGVVVDTEVPTYQSWRDIYAEHGVDLALSDWLPAVGSGSSTSGRRGSFDAVAHLERLIGATVDRADVIARRTRRKEELYVRAPLLPGVRERLMEAKRLGLRTAIVTRNRTDRVTAQCRRVGLHHEWGVLVCANEDPTGDKAELYRRALDLLDVRIEEALAFEDSPSGVRAAKRAGLVCVAVPNEITRAASFDEADLVLGSLAECSIAELVSTFSSAAMPTKRERPAWPASHKS